MVLARQRFKWLMLIGLAVLAPAAHADLMSTLTVNGCSSGCGSGPFGTVSVTQVNSTTVQVSLMLAPLEVFAKTGAGSPFGYNLNTAASLVGGSLTSGFAAGGSNGFAGGLGNFTNTILCPACGNGTSTPQFSGPIQFQLTGAGLTSANFVANANGFFFGADIGVKNAAGTVLGTGVVGADSVSFSAVPEPGSVLLLFTVLGGTVLTFKKRMTA
jgi:hypothetical protein